MSNEQREFERPEIERARPTAEAQPVSSATGPELAIPDSIVIGVGTWRWNLDGNLQRELVRADGSRHWQVVRPVTKFPFDVDAVRGGSVGNPAPVVELPPGAGAVWPSLDFGPPGDVTLAAPAPVEPVASPDDETVLEAAGEIAWEALGRWAATNLGEPGAHLTEIRQRLAGV